MKWIKANERLPEILERNYIVRQKGNSRSAHAVWWAHVHGNVEGYLKLALYDIEWLDESESPTTADASVLVEALEKIIALPGEWNEAKQLARKALADFLYPGMNNEVKAEYSTQSPSPSSGVNGLLEALEKIVISNPYKQTEGYEEALYMGYHSAGKRIKEALVQYSIQYISKPETPELREG